MMRSGGLGQDERHCTPYDHTTALRYSTHNIYTSAAVRQSCKLPFKKNIQRTQSLAAAQSPVWIGRRLDATTGQADGGILKLCSDTEMVQGYNHTSVAIAAAATFRPITQQLIQHTSEWTGIQKEKQRMLSWLLPRPVNDGDDGTIPDSVHCLGHDA